MTDVVRDSTDRAQLVLALDVPAHYFGGWFIDRHGRWWLANR